MQEASRRRMMQDIPKADVVITNPTHFAVAVRYDAKEAAAPVVLAKGEDHLAAKIKEVARENKVEIVESSAVHNGIVDDPDKFGNNAFPDFRNPLFFNTAYTVGFDIDLVGNGGRAEYSPGSPVVLHFLYEDILTYIYHFIIFLCCIWHTLFII